MEEFKDDNAIKSGPLPPRPTLLLPLLLLLLLPSLLFHFFPTLSLSTIHRILFTNLPPIFIIFHSLCNLSLRSCPSPSLASLSHSLQLSLFLPRFSSHAAILSLPLPITLWFIFHVLTFCMQDLLFGPVPSFLIATLPCHNAISHSPTLATPFTLQFPFSSTLQVSLPPFRLHSRAILQLFTPCYVLCSMCSYCNSPSPPMLHFPSSLFLPLQCLTLVPYCNPFSSNVPFAFFNT